MDKKEFKEFIQVLGKKYREKSTKTCQLKTDTLFLNYKRAFHILLS